MEKPQKFAMLISLKEMALRRVAVHLYSDSDVSASISGLRLHWFNRHERRLVWREMIARIKDKVLKLGLPTSLTKQMIEIGTPIFLQIKKWRDQQDYHLKIKMQEINLSYSEKLCWTPEGLIDNKKTAEKFVCADFLDAVQRYKLACFNCLDDYIPLLWEKLSEEEKEYFYNESRPKKRFAACLHFCWPYILKGELSKLDSVWNRRDEIAINRNFSWGGHPTSFYQWVFKYSALNGNKAATEYFFQKLTRRQKATSLTRTAKAVLCNLRSRGESEILCYLVSLMNSEQQREIIEEDPVGVFMCILECPWPDLFSEIAGLFWVFYPPNKYERLFRSIKDVVEDHYFPKVFQEFFIQSPPNFKEYFIRNPSYAFRCLSICFNFEDSESIKVIFGNISAADRMRTMLRYQVLTLFYECMLQDKWHMVDVCLREGILSKEDREIFKNAFVSFLTVENGGPIDIADPKWKRLFEFLDDANASPDQEKKAQKRKLENCSPE